MDGSRIIIIHCFYWNGCSECNLEVGMNLIAKYDMKTTLKKKEEERKNYKQRR